jgi:hypothetical protein
MGDRAVECAVPQERAPSHVQPTTTGVAKTLTNDSTPSTIALGRFRAEERGSGRRDARYI